MPPVAAYAEQEAQYADQKLIEIVLVGSDSIETVKLTHANYFEGSLNTSRYFAGI